MFVCVHVCACMCTGAHACVSVCWFVCMRVYMLMCVHVCVQVHMYVCVCMSMCVHVCVQIHMHLFLCVGVCKYTCMGVHACGDQSQTSGVFYNHASPYLRQGLLMTLLERQLAHPQGLSIYTSSLLDCRHALLSPAMDLNEVFVFAENGVCQLTFPQPPILVFEILTFF